MEYLSFLLCLLLAWFAIYLLSAAYKGGKLSNARNLPPGPSPFPIVGNLLSIGSQPHVSLAELAKIYGPLMTLQLGQVPTVVISSAAVAKEALHKNDVSFSNRMVLDASRAHNHHQNSLVFLPANARWRNLRKICNSLLFSTSRLDASQTFRRNKVDDLLSYVQKSSESGTSLDIGQAAFTVTLNLLSSTFFSINLGYPESDVAPEFRQLIRAELEAAGRINLADYFPFLRRIDPQGIRRRATVNGSKILGIFDNIIKQRLQNERSQSKDVLDALLGIHQDKTANIEPLEIYHLFSDLFIAGIDTTSSTLEWAMAELLHNAEKLKKAQTELEEIIGKGNPIEEANITRLPYLQAIIKETFRLHPAVPFLVPRRVDSDVKLLGYTVPKNAQVLVNVWAIGRDPNIWENPNSFEPERFLGSEIDFKGHDFELIPFGAGRRICPGLPLAIRMVHLMLASLIHGFDWKLEGGISPEKMNMEESFGFTLRKALPLCAIPQRR